MFFRSRAGMPVCIVPSQTISRVNASLVSQFVRAQIGFILKGRLLNSLEMEEAVRQFCYGLHCMNVYAFNLSSRKKHKTKQIKEVVFEEIAHLNNFELIRALDFIRANSYPARERYFEQFEKLRQLIGLISYEQIRQDRKYKEAFWG